MDVCSGTGTIGLSLAKEVKRVIGVELNADAVEDARENARRNGIANAVFLASTAEAAMRHVQYLAGVPLQHQELETEAPAVREQAEAARLHLAEAGVAADPDEPLDVVAVVDPPRGGLHPDVIRALRVCAPLRRLVYVSCNPTGSFVENAIRLCKPEGSRKGKLAGRPFRLLQAVPVDMFPFTEHFEFVAVFERA